MKKVFLDTNIPIAFLFNINSLHAKSIEVFKIYSEFYWSEYIKEEFNWRFPKKQNNLSIFFNDMIKYFEIENKEYYSASDLKKFAKKQYFGKTMNDAKKSIDPFWNEYIGIESQISLNNMKHALYNCLNDLSLILTQKRTTLEKYMKLTPPRIKTYTKIDSLLESEGVSTEDRHVILDGHDFACQITEPIDFITFDEVCFNGASTVEKICFESVKGKYDFKN